ncbi:MAG: tetrahydromethanopterin S-methyltransferase subunit A [Methanotrichaceae archaeon]|nr:tetrahydromethanopterin S-methyltransferase subunit A [Methanotrichaceae archaeon]
MDNGTKLLKIKTPPDYPPEDGRYLRGNDYSPVAVVAILAYFDFEIPEYLENLVRISIETGAALAGTLQTENIGLEKVIANIVANPNIRYVILCGRESAGHLTGEAFIALMKNGVDEKRNIVGTDAPHPTLHNIPMESIDRFRKQITLINLLDEVNPDINKKGVWSCYQEEPTEFMGYNVYDYGAFPEPSICKKITWKITQPWTYVEDEKALTTMSKVMEAAKKVAKPEAASPSKIATSKLPQTWYVFKDNMQYGPLDPSMIIEWLREGRITIYDFIWTPHFGSSWKRIIDVLILDTKNNHY